MNIARKPPGFRQYYDRETLEKYMTMPARMKLQWLEEINRFLYQATPEKNKVIQQMFRSGKL